MTVADAADDALVQRRSATTAVPKDAGAEPKAAGTSAQARSAQKVVPEPRALRWLQFPEVPAPSVWPTDKGALDRWDKSFSKPLFMLQLSRSLEIMLSIPGCFFSMPAFLALGPSVLLLACSGVEGNTALAAAVACAGCMMLVLWASALKRERPLLPLFYSPLTVLCAPLLGLLVAALLGGDSARDIRSLANFYVVAWVATDIPILACKKVFRRRRPIACPAAYLGKDVVAAACKKHLSFLGRLLLHLDPNGSFPSGDVAGAVSFAFALWRGGGGLASGCACVLLCSFARVYWQAHHLLDVFVGCLVAVASCYVLELVLLVYGIAFVGGEDEVPACGAIRGAICNARWWHFLLAQAAHSVTAEQVANWNRCERSGGNSADPDEEKEK